MQKRPKVRDLDLRTAKHATEYRKYRAQCQSKWEFESRPPLILALYPRLGKR